MIVETLKPLIRVAQIVNMDWAKYEQLKSKTKKTDEEWALFLKLDVERGEFESLEDAAKHLQKGVKVDRRIVGHDHTIVVEITEDLRLWVECKFRGGTEVRGVVETAETVGNWKEVEGLSMVAEYLVGPLTDEF